MPCYHPLEGWFSKVKNTSGKRSIVFCRADALVDRPVVIPCGQCIGCRLERSRQWAVRCVHEASLYASNCFITLTFRDSSLTPSLVKSDFQKFMKRLRKRFPNDKIRYFHCGEYGSELGRPHHHACLFNFDFLDKVLVRDGAVKLYRSAILEDVWPFGFCTVGEVTFDSAAYVARYVTKKVTGAEKDSHYGQKLPEYITMSRRPGIGSDWIRKFTSDVYPINEIVLRGGIKMRPPRYYENIYDIDFPDHKALLRHDRRIKLENKLFIRKNGSLIIAPKRDRDRPERLDVREKLRKKLLLEKGLRSYETTSV